VYQKLAEKFALAENSNQLYKVSAKAVESQALLIFHLDHHY
jgi:hypothetical protein